MADIEEPQAIPDAFTPIINLVFSDIEIDLLHARLPSMSFIPEDIDLRDDSVLQGLDDKNVRSINGSLRSFQVVQVVVFTSVTGPRVAMELLELVPNVRHYRDALCAIKLWAASRFSSKKGDYVSDLGAGRSISGNALGYLGGISWALMTGRAP